MGPRSVSVKPASAELPGQEAVGKSGVRRPGGRSVKRRAGSQHEVDLPRGDGAGYAREVDGVEAGVGIHERHDRRGRCGQPGEAGGTKAPGGLVHHQRTAGLGDVVGAVGGAVVHHDGPVPFRQTRQQPPDACRLVQRRENDIDGLGPWVMLCVVQADLRYATQRSEGG